MCLRGAQNRNMGNPVKGLQNIDKDGVRNLSPSGIVSTVGWYGNISPGENSTPAGKELFYLDLSSNDLFREASKNKGFAVEGLVLATNFTDKGEVICLSI